MFTSTPTEPESISYLHDDKTNLELALGEAISTADAKRRKKKVYKKKKKNKKVKKSSSPSSSSSSSKKASKRSRERSREAAAFRARANANRTAKLVYLRNHANIGGSSSEAISKLTQAILYAEYIKNPDIFNDDSIPAKAKEVLVKNQEGKLDLSADIAQKLEKPEVNTKLDLTDDLTKLNNQLEQNIELDDDGELLFFTFLFFFFFL